LEAEFKRGARGVPTEIRDFLLGFKPYKSGNRLLWGLNKVRNSVIHRIIAPVLFAPQAVILGDANSGSFDLTIRSFTPIFEWNEAKREFIYGRGKVTGRGMTVEIGLGFTESSPLGPTPLLDTLQAMKAEVDGLISALEQQTEHILISGPPTENGRSPTTATAPGKPFADDERSSV
jgi:hypothetical protein